MNYSLFVCVLALLGVSRCDEQILDGEPEGRTLGKFVPAIGTIAHKVGHLLTGAKYHQINRPVYAPGCGGLGGLGGYYNRPGIYGGFNRPGYISGSGYDLYDFKK